MTAAAKETKLSFWAIVVISANTLNGPGLTTLPSVAESAGLITFVILVVVSACVTSFVLKRLCDVMWSHTCVGKPILSNDVLTQVTDDRYLEESEEDDEINHGHQDRNQPLLEQTSIVALTKEAYDGHPIVIRLASVAMVGCALSLALAQMMLCAAIADSMLVAGFGRSCGLGLSSFPSLHCTSDLSMKPFQQQEAIPIPLASAGLAISAAITISLASVDLDSLIASQYALFGCLLVSVAKFCITLRSMDTDSGIISSKLESSVEPHFVMGPRPFDAIGPLLFNFAFVVTAPPLSCGAGSRSTAFRALATACVLMGTLYVLVGYVGSHAVSSLQGIDDMDENLLSLVLYGGGTTADVIAVALFGLSQLAAIPVYCELARETLLQHILPTSSRKGYAFATSHILPWVVCALTYNSTFFEKFVEWSSLLLLGFANFSFPLWLDLQLSSSRTNRRASNHLTRTRKTGAGPNAVLWTFVMVTASIAAVIVQRITQVFMLSEVTFMLVFIKGILLDIN